MTLQLNRTLLRTLFKAPVFYASAAATMSSLAPEGAPGKDFEVRQTASSDDWTPNPSKSLSLPPNRQRLIDDILALYGCDPTVERVKRYTADCVYDDQFVYADNRYKMAGCVICCSLG